MKNLLFTFVAGLGCILLAGCVVVYPKIARTSPNTVGKVVDAETGKPVSGAQIKIRGEQYAATKSDDTGHFWIDGSKSLKVVIANPANGSEFPRDADPDLDSILEISHSNYESNSARLYQEDGRRRFSDAKNPESIRLYPHKP